MAAPSHAQIQGAGSSWAANAVNQWVSDVQGSELGVVYTGSGSAQGRKDFANVTTDFAVSDLAFQGADPVTGSEDTNCAAPNNCREYTFAPIVGGGTSFPYQLRVNGKLIKNLRLSGTTLAGIFTGTITNWNDPQIKADNNGRVLPAIPMLPVVHSEGSGASYNFSDYLAHRYPTVWSSFAGTSAPTAYWPAAPNATTQSGSDGVMNYVTSTAANGAIGYDEYSYALAKNFPVAKVQNAAGYFVLPGQFNVSIALRRAMANPAGLPDLTGVYADTDPRSYPVSTTSSMIIPTGAADRRMTTAKRQTLVDFLYHDVCQGQSKIGPIGYAPLPLNLTRAALDGSAKLHDADPNVDLTGRDLKTCNNLTFTAGDEPVDNLDTLVPQPQACEQVGAGPCTDGDNASPPNPPPAPAITASALAVGGTIHAGSPRALTATLRTARDAVAHASISLFASTASGPWHRVAALRTDNRGGFRATVRPLARTRYQAQFAGTPQYAASNSNVVTVAVRFSVSSHLSRRSVRAEHPVSITGRVVPSRPGELVVLQRFLHGHWRAVQATLLRNERLSDGRHVVGYRFRYVPRTHRTYVLRVVRPATPTNSVGTSPTMRLRVRR